LKLELKRALCFVGSLLGFAGCSLHQIIAHDAESLVSRGARWTSITSLGADA
jgi:hypothetical protein